VRAQRGLAGGMIAAGVGFVVMLVIWAPIHYHTAHTHTQRTADAVMLSNEHHMWRMIAGLDPVDQSVMGKFAAAIKPLVDVDRASSNPLTSGSFANLETVDVVGGVYDGLNEDTYDCILAGDTATNPYDVCQDYGKLTQTTINDLSEIAHGGGQGTLLTVVKPMTSYRTVGWSWELVEALWMLEFSVGFGVGLLLAVDVESRKKVYSLDATEKFALAAAAVLDPPVVGLGIVAWIAWGAIRRAGNLRQWKLERTLARGEARQFAGDLTGLVALREKLRGMPICEEVEKARQYVDAAIKTVNAVPGEIAKDEARIKAVGVMKDARALMVPAQTHLEAHRELMAEYHNAQLKSDLKELLPGENGDCVRVKFHPESDAARWHVHDPDGHVIATFTNKQGAIERAMQIGIERKLDVAWEDCDGYVEGRNRAAAR
jgi:hypothetical protein